MSKIVATLPSHPRFNGTNYSDTKELMSVFSVVGIKDGELAEVATARIYRGRSKTSTRVYATVWVRGLCSGSGYAGGGGYHRGSAAVAGAIHSAGITLSGSIDAAGDSAIEAALLAIAEAMGYSKNIVIKN